jgi:hypothetical protein
MNVAADDLPAPNCPIVQRPILLLPALTSIGPGGEQSRQDFAVDKSP